MVNRLHIQKGVQLRKLVVFLGCVAIYLCTLTGSAASPGAEVDIPATQKGSSEFRMIVLFVDWDAAEWVSSEQAIGAQLADLPVTVSFYRMGSAAGEQNRWLDFAGARMEEEQAAAAVVISPAEERTLIILVRKGNRIKVTTRAVETAAGMPRHEAFAVIIRSIVSTLVDRKQLLPAHRLQRKEPEPSKVTTVDKGSGASMDDPKTTPPSFFMGLGASLERYAADTALSPGMWMGIGWQSHHNFQVYAGIVLFSKVSGDGLDTTLTLTRYPVHLGIRYLRTRNRLAFGGGGAIRMEYAAEKLSTKNPELILGTQGGELHWSLQLNLLASVAITRMWSVFAEGGISVPLQNNQYAISISSGNLVLVDPLPVQPYAMIGLMVHFF